MTHHDPVELSSGMASWFNVQKRCGPSEQCRGEAGEEDHLLALRGRALQQRAGLVTNTAWTVQPIDAGLG